MRKLFSAVCAALVSACCMLCTFADIPPIDWPSETESGSVPASGLTPISPLAIALSIGAVLVCAGLLVVLLRKKKR